MPGPCTSARLFCYNPSPNPLIAGTEQIGSIAAVSGAAIIDSSHDWWLGPCEDEGYVVCYVDPSGDRPNSVERILGGNVPCYLGFKKSSAKTDQSFIDLVKSISGNQSLATTENAKNWLTANGYWTSFSDTYTYDSVNTLPWPTSAGYTLYSGTVSNIDDGWTTTPITLPVAFSTNGTSSNQLYVSTNGYFTLATPSPAILNGPTTPTPATMAANPGDNWLQFGLVMTDGDTQNLYYQTGSQGSNKHYVKLLVYNGTFGGPTVSRSWIANFYRDSVYQWLEVRGKQGLTGFAGPYNSPSVAQPSSAVSLVWRGDLNGQNWVYLGTGSVV